MTMDGTTGILQTGEWDGEIIGDGEILITDLTGAGTIGTDQVGEFTTETLGVGEDTTILTIAHTTMDITAITVEVVET